MISYFIDHVCLYWSIAVALALLSGIRAIFVQKHGGKIPSTMRLTAKLFIHYGHDALYNAVSVLAGFVALKAAALMFRSIKDYSSVDIGTSTLLIFLILFSVLGIACVLPRFFSRGAFWSGQKGKGNPTSQGDGD
jgi:hypothetical protein